jgi:uncharacterized protein YjaZ
MLRVGWKHIIMEFYGSHSNNYSKLIKLLYTTRMQLKNLAKKDEKLKNIFQSSQFWKKYTKKLQYSIKGGLCNVKHIQCHCPKYYDDQLFASNEYGEYAYNLLLP